MGQTTQCRGVATSIRQEGAETVVRYHHTDVVRFDTEQIRLDSGGWRTVTTKTRMNQASRQFGLGYYVSQMNFAWYVVDAAGNSMEFYDGMFLTRAVG